MAEHTSLDSLFSDIADSIRAKSGTTSSIQADNFPLAIMSIPTGGGGGISVTIAETGTASANTAKTLTTDISTGTYLFIVSSNYSGNTNRSASYLIVDGVTTQIYVGIDLSITFSSTRITIGSTGSVKSYQLLRIEQLGRMVD